MSGVGGDPAVLISSWISRCEREIPQLKDGGRLWTKVGLDGRGHFWEHKMFYAGKCFR